VRSLHRTLPCQFSAISHSVGRWMDTATNVRLAPEKYSKSPKMRRMQITNRLRNPRGRPWCDGRRGETMQQSVRTLLVNFGPCPSWSQMCKEIKNLNIGEYSTIKSVQKLSLPNGSRCTNRFLANKLLIRKSQIA